MAKYFTISELSHSDTAKAKDIDNTPNAEQTANMETLINKLLDPLREEWGAPITVNSGFRSLALNTAIGGAKDSQHMKGLAADLNAGSKAKNEQLYKLLLSSGLQFDQAIDESNFTWLHVSYNEGSNRNMAFKL